MSLKNSLIPTLIITFAVFNVGCWESASAASKKQGILKEDLPLLPIQKHETIHPHEVELEEILKWEDLSDQYTLGYGKDEITQRLVPFAIYDKSFTTPFFENFFEFLVLGSIGVGDLSLARLARKIKKLEPNSKNSNIELPIEFFSHPKISWKESQNPFLISKIPPVIFLKDIYWEKSTSIQIVFDSIFGSSKAMNNIEFRLQKNGFYRLYRPQTITLSEPVKIIDFRDKFSSLKRAAAWSSTTNIIKGGIGAIPLFGGAQAIAAMMERTFDFIELLYFHHQSQALILILEALKNNHTSPFIHPVLDHDHLDNALFYLLRANPMISEILKNVFTKNDLLTSKYLDKIEAKKKQSLDSLIRRGMLVFPLSDSYFALGARYDSKTNQLQKLKLYTLDFTKLGRSSKPHAVVDFLNPNYERKKRNLLQGILFGSNFLFLPIPGISSVLKLLYKEIIIREIHRRQVWENGYLSHEFHSPHELKDVLMQKLKFSESEADKLERLAVSSLEDRRINPIDFTRDESEIQKKKVEAWIKQRDASYQPWNKTPEPTPTFYFLNAS